MIRKSDEKIVQVQEHAFNGEGSIKVRHISNGPEELNNKGRTFAHTTLQQGCSVGFHIHKGEAETYYIYQGKGEYNDNGIITTVSAGDVTYCPAETGHGIKNIGDEPLEMIALILYK